MPHPNQPVVVRHPEAPSMMVALDRAIDYDEDDILVQTYPQFFVQVEGGSEVIESVTIERATAEPGTKRRVGRPKKTAEPGK